ncbi:MAG TPA: hypothetical protein VG225_09915 [Terracidiphilus sp.]|jgi:hypothetical protein|nr:hypothetical protein [Terracidiphilus sp.]
MRLVTSPERKLSLRQISAAAENIAAAQFAMCGFDVLPQAGRSRFFYDLGIANSGGMLKVSVHGSLYGFWNLVDPYLDKPARAGGAMPDYHRAIDKWLQRQGAGVTCCLVQFEEADLSRMPRIYLASAAEIAEKLHQSADRLGDSALYEEYEEADGNGLHRVESLPAGWRFSAARVAELSYRLAANSGYQAGAVSYQRAAAS